MNRILVLAATLLFAVAGCTPAASAPSYGTADDAPASIPTVAPATDGGSPASQTRPASSDAGPSPTRGPQASAPTAPTGSPAQAERALASRLVIPALGIDLPVVSGELELPGGPPDLPLCGVAHYSPAYRQPGEVGTAYLYGHAQRGMLLPLLRASERADGRELLGMTVEVYTNDGLRHTYRIGTVRRHATNYHLADSVRPGDQRLVIQTSEGPEGTVPKLQVAAAHVASEQARLADALPIADPRPCG